MRVILPALPVILLAFLVCCTAAPDRFYVEQGSGSFTTPGRSYDDETLTFGLSWALQPTRVRVLTDATPRTWLEPEPVALGAGIDAHTGEDGKIHLGIPLGVVAAIVAAALGYRTLKKSK